MRNIVRIGIAAATLSLVAGVALAQELAQNSGQPPAAQPAAADSAAPAAPATGPSADSTIQDLLANPATKAVLAKDLPALLTYDGLDQIKGMSIRQISQFPQANIDAAKLAQIDADLKAAGGAAAPAAAQ
jgi:hypothetical protein